MRLFFPLLLAVTFAPGAAAQQIVEAPDTLQPASSTIYLQGTVFGGNKWVQNAQYHSAGGSFGRLRDALVAVPKAYELAGVGSKIVTHGRVVSILGTAIGAATFFVHGDVANWSATIGGVVVTGIGGAIQMKGRNRINEAVWLYNETVRGDER